MINVEKRKEITCNINDDFSVSIFSGDKEILSYETEKKDFYDTDEYTISETITIQCYENGEEDILRVFLEGIEVCFHVISIERMDKTYNDGIKLKRRKDLAIIHSTFHLINNKLNFICPELKIRVDECEKLLERLINEEL